MRSIRYTLLADGPSDRCLIRVIDWLLDDILKSVQIAVNAQFADMRMLRNPPSGLSERIKRAIEQYPCDVLFVHRDAEKAARENRVDEISRAIKGTAVDFHVAVVPVRMTDAWLLIDEGAIRRAADNPNGKVMLTLPALNRIEGLSNPKNALRDLLVAASEKTGRRLKQFKRDLGQRVHRVADLINDFSALRQLAAFRALEKDTRETLATLP